MSGAAAAAAPAPGFDVVRLDGKRAAVAASSLSIPLGRWATPGRRLSRLGRLE